MKSFLPCVPTGFLVGCLLIAIGCSDKPVVVPPKTYPVTGKVVVPGGQLLEGGRILFYPEDLELRAQGTIEADGSFLLTVLFNGQKLSGATEGLHRVTVRMPIAADRGGGKRIALEETYLIEPQSNDFTITLKGQ